MYSNLEVIDPGLRSIMVDSGRSGRQGEGFCQAGALDEEAYRWANWLCYNPSGTPAIETLGATRWRLEQDGVIAVTGKGGTVHIDGICHSLWQSIEVKKGSQIEVVPDHPASRHYLAVAGQWNIQPVAGSVTTVLREQLGGHHQDGSALKASEVLSIHLATPESHRVVAPGLIPDYSLARPLEVVPGYQASQFSRVALQIFYSSPYTVTAQIDRMGYRLKGMAVPFSVQQMHSEGINFGAIQIPGDGQPIIMMKDRQTLGGYPKLGCVAVYDLHRLAQAAPGDQVCFIPVEAENARARWLLKQQRIQLLI